MSERYTWDYLDAGGDLVTGAEGPSHAAFPTQADAEAWFSENWQACVDAGVAEVTLRRDGEVVYGPMSLAAPE
ncbi:hypothetical protein [Janibacter massiliensis]|uniref:hypothetical protein n=1 Tax=Janibacter massiliensis TaxID=2058291 RepID=UPI000D107C53|nr:hypothetical protein [Janibacter massiliensis]